MRITAADLKRLGVIDRIVAEPVGGAHRDRDAAFKMLAGALGEELDDLAKLSPEAVRAARREKFLAIG
jgi:acetyl-CoA carboxylase carboxyl transferase subunit alpha